LDFNVADGVFTLTKGDGSTITVDLDGRFTDNDFADSVMNEIWPFLRTLWRAIGEFEFAVTFDTMGLDGKHFDYNMNKSWDYFSDINFAIDKDGYWDAIMKFKLDDRGPFKNDGSFDNTFTGNGKW
ncbi:hypothetical protein EB151_10360, partial [archaeon]|nr:hypothetical protein [archaeon]